VRRWSTPTCARPARAGHAYAPIAVSVGFRSVHPFPLRLRKDVIGAMGVFGREIGDFDDADVQIVQALAGVAAIGLHRNGRSAAVKPSPSGCTGGLNSRIIIEQAKGAIAQAHNVTVDVAFEVIRAYAHSNNRRLSERSTEAWPTRESAISSAMLSRD
jgi:hypothetical protein